MRHLVICGTILLSLPAPSLGATFERDDRIAVTRPDAAFLPIGVVKGGKRVAYATGFLVGDCHVLTVKHAAGRVGKVTGRRMTFRLPFAGRDGTSAGSVVAAGELDLVADPAPHRPLMSAGFPIDRSWRRQLTVDPQCRLRGTPRNLFVHDCSSLPGNSGSPIFATAWRDGQASLVVVAMHSTAAVAKRVLTYRAEDGSVATRISDVLPAIRAHLAPSALAANPGPSGASSAAVVR